MKISWLTRQQFLLLALSLSLFLSRVGKPGLKYLQRWYTNDCGTKALLQQGKMCACDTMAGEGGVSEGRDLIRCVRMGVYVWVWGVYLVKSSVGRRRWAFIKMNPPLPVSLSLALHKTRMATCCGVSKRLTHTHKETHISSHTHEVSITNVGNMGKCILLRINETSLC